MIVNNYKINEHTMVLKPSKAMNYDTIVMEGEEQYHVRQTAFSLINEACHDDCTNYEGRRDAVSKRTRFVQKVPIPLNINKKMYAFPTHKVNHSDCHWIFCSHIREITEVRQTKKALIHFKNDIILPLNVSAYTLQKQLHRTLTCMMYFSID